MIFRKNGHQRHYLPGKVFQAPQRLAGPDAKEAAVQSGFLDRGEHFAGRQIQQFHLALGPGFTKHPQHFGQVQPMQVADEAEPEPFVLAALHPLRRENRPVKLLENFSGVIQKHPPGCRQLDPTGFALQQFNAQLLLQALDLPA